MVNRLYREIDLRRAYFSAFQPIEGTPLEDVAATSPLREHRLYQSDFLMRQYGFRFDDLVFDENGQLPLAADPKKMWADGHPELFPVEVGKATREQLLRVPGIGLRSADRIINGRRQRSFCSLQDLTRVGVVAGRAAPYILLGGKRPDYQLPLW